MRLSELTRELAIAARWGPPHDPLIAGITADSRAVGAGSLFVAVRGERLDGHDFIADAVRRGAAAVVAERPVGAGFPVPFVAVPDSRRALALLAGALHGHPARHLAMVGVTGTVGKTSTTLILREILAHAGVAAGAIGSLGIVGGSIAEPSAHTTPDPLALQGALARLRAERVEVVAMELSSHALAQERAYGILYDAAVITNLLPLEHVDYHGSFAAYLRTKARILDQVKPGGTVVYNADDPHACNLAARHPGRRISFGFGRGADVRAERVITGATGSAFAVVLGECLTSSLAGGPRAVPVRLPLLGTQNVVNALAALATALGRGVDAGTAARALGRIRPFRRRMEPLAIGGLRVLDDTVGHPSSIDRLFSCIEALAEPSLVVLVAIRGARGPGINAANAHRVAHWCRRLPVRALFVTESLDATDERNRVRPEESAAFLGALREAGLPYRFTPSLDEACRLVAAAATPWDLVVLAGAQGMDRGAEWLQRWAAPSPGRLEQAPGATAGRG